MHGGRCDGAAPLHGLTACKTEYQFRAGARAGARRPRGSGASTAAGAAPMAALSAHSGALWQAAAVGAGHDSRRAGDRAANRRLAALVAAAAFAGRRALVLLHRVAVGGAGGRLRGAAAIGFARPAGFPVAAVAAAAHLARAALAEHVGLEAAARFFWGGGVPAMRAGGCERRSRTAHSAPACSGRPKHLAARRLLYSVPPAAAVTWLPERCPMAPKAAALDSGLTRSSQSPLSRFLCLQHCRVAAGLCVCQ
jgi:hypothetical protein